MAPGRPMGFGYGAPRKYVPFAKKKGSPVKYFAGQEETVFGTCW